MGRTRAPDIVMLLENCGYPLDARVRMEAETLLAEGNSVEVIAPLEAGQPRRETVRGVSVRRFRIPDGRGTLAGTALEYAAAATLFGLAALHRIAASPTGTLHVHNPPDLFFPLLWLARRRGWSTVFDYHDDAAGMLRAKSEHAARLAGSLEWMRDRSASTSDLTIATNDTQREAVAGLSPQAVVVRNSPPLWFAEHEPSPPQQPIRMVFLGEIGEQDRVERAVEILHELTSRRGIDAELLVIGDGPCRPAVEERARELGVSRRLKVSGWVEFEQVPALLASAHVGLDTAPPTDVNDGSTMIKIMEYMAVGLPVIATDLRETRVTAAGAATLVQEDSIDAFADRVAALADSEEAWRRSAEAARRRGTELMWPAQAEVLLNAYRSIQERARRRTRPSAG